MEIKQVAEQIGIAPREWEGNCYSIACKITKAGLVEGIPRYGHWLGPVVSGSIFDKGMPFVRHGWIEQENGMIVDPTRWVFEGVEPYIWSGLDDGNYDPGGNIWRRNWERPCPEYTSSGKQINLEFDNPEDYSIIMDMLRYPPNVTVEHAFWLANLSILTLGMKLAKGVYQALEKAGLRAAIPIDNWVIVMGQ